MCRHTFFFSRYNSFEIYCKIFWVFISFKKAFCVLILSIMLNVIFINLWGIIGAAIATLATEFISLTLLNYLFKGGIVLKLHAYKIFTEVNMLYKNMVLI